MSAAAIDVNTAVIEEWVEALESGEYEQGRAALRVPGRFAGNADRYCCLGVLCEIAVKHGVTTRTSNDSGYWDSTLEGYVNNVLPTDVVAWAGVGSMDPIIDTHQHGAAYYNDAKRWNFNQIAQAIRKTFLTTNTTDNNQGEPS